MSGGFLKNFRVPHVFTLLTFIIFLTSVATYLIPSGSYERKEQTFKAGTKTVVVPGTYAGVEKHYSVRGVLIGDEESQAGAASPISVLGFLTAIPRGLEKSSDIVFFIFVLGGVFGILQSSGMIPAIVRRLLEQFGHSAPLLTIIIMLTLAVGGSTLGMGEEFIPLVPVFLIISQRLGYDRIYGLALVLLAAEMGFAAATTNPFTVQIAQNISGVPLGSGMGLRIVFFVCAMAFTLVHVLRYGARIKRDPTASLLYGDTAEVEVADLDEHDLTGGHVLTLVSCLVIFAGILVGSQKLGWFLPEMAGGFLLMAFAAVIFCRMRVGDATKSFVRGMEEMVVAAMVVGFARGIEVVADDAEILDSVIFAAASLLEHVPTVVSAVGMLVFQSTLNFFIPSGSGQAVVTMPVMAPLADVLGITRQTAVLAFQFGDGLSNTIIPTSGILMAMLSLAKIPYGTWVRFFLPLFLQLFGLAAAFLVVAVMIGYA